ncbi:MAG: TerC family protein [Solirubrobacterales bacterium]
MDNIILIIIPVLQIALLDIVLSGDNIGVIALATKDLPENYAKKASALGVFIAVLLRIIFASMVTWILMIKWLPIKLIGGILLIKITFDLLIPKSKGEGKRVSTSVEFFDAVKNIILADAAMSLDNVLAIAGTANGSISLIIFGLLFNIPIIFYGSRYAAIVMKNHPFVIYIGGAILAHTACKMILEDILLQNLFSSGLLLLIPDAAAFITLALGFLYLIRSKYYL